MHISKPLLFSIIGALTGLIVAQISQYVEIENIEVALFSFCLLVLSFSLLWEKLCCATLLKFLSLLTLILSAITFYYFSQNYHTASSIGLGPIYPIGVIQLTIICTTFFQSWRSSKPHFSYDELFENAWNNHFFFIFSGILVGAFLLILALGSQLFDMLGFNASKWIWNRAVTPIIIGALLGAGIAISRDYDQLIFKLRSLLFALFKILAYLAAVILILFALLLPFTIDNLFANKNTSLILLSLVAISIILLNALKDTEFSEFPKLSQCMFNVQIVLLPMFSGLSIYAIYLRIEQYGLMPQRVVALWAAILIGVYALAYLIQLLINKGQWNLGFAAVNKPLAFFWVISIVLLSSPLLDPVKLSVNNQVARLQNNTVAPNKFDFYTLRYRLGDLGKTAIEEISNWNDHPKIDSIRQQIAKSKDNSTNVSLNISVIGEAPKDVEKLKRDYTSWRCNQIRPCFIKNMKLNNDVSNKKQPMVFSFIQLSNNNYRLNSDYYRYDKNWIKVSTFESKRFKKARIANIIHAIKNQQAILIQPKYLDFEIDGIQLRR